MNDRELLLQIPPPQPLPDAITAPFWEAARQSRLVMNRCQDCKTWQQPPLEACRRCAGETAWEQISGNGVIYSFVVQRQGAVVGYFDKVPYVVAIVELEEQPLLRLPGRVVDIDIDDIRCDMPVTVKFEPLPGGDFVIPVWSPRTI